MRRLILLGLLLLLPQARAVTDLRVLLEPDGRGVWRELAARFHKQNPDLRLVVIEGPASTDSREDMYVNSLLANSGDYDLVYADTIWIPKFAAAGWLTDLTGHWPESRWSSYVPAALEAGKYKGRIYRLPSQLNGGILYYRADLLEEAGLSPPRTYDELRDVSMKLQKEGLLGYVWQGKQYEGLTCNFLEVLGGYGGFWIKDGQVGLDRPEATQALEFLCKAVGGISPAGVTTYAEEESRLLFQSGGALFLRNWPYVSNILSDPKNKPEFPVGIAPLPARPGHSPAPTFGGAGFAIVKSSPAQEATWRFLEFVSSPEIEKFLYERGGLQPASRRFYQETNDPRQKQLYEAMQHTVARPAIPQYAQASDILQRCVSAALTGRMPPAEALRRAAEETRRLLPPP